MKPAKKAVKRVAKAKPSPKFEMPPSRDVDTLIRTPAYNDWIHLELKVIPENWIWSKTTFMLRSSTPLSRVADLLREKHGKVAEICFAKSPNDHLRKGNALPLNLTLADIGFHGGPQEANSTESLYYDFIPDSHDSLLLFEPAPIETTVVASSSSSSSSSSATSGLLSGTYTAAALQGSGAMSLASAGTASFPSTGATAARSSGNPPRSSYAFS